MAAMVNMSNLINGKDSRWLQLEVCREFQRNKCSRPDTECKFAHPAANVEVQNGRVTACYDSIKVSLLDLIWSTGTSFMSLDRQFIIFIIVSFSSHSRKKVMDVSWWGRADVMHWLESEFIWNFDKNLASNEEGSIMATWGQCLGILVATYISNPSKF